ncbi:2-succinyl-5-enolpyruvyl-6-hydroxy-3-cyclohexene-1-carboxylic-acid synthase [Nodularia harveyana UHCC-0300]|uniref:2-succinyl-5-enolpyruvyl-6-hydroxy-3-cyclohexene-1-carboxylate synthase n=1 Tax=Nodularia harveyana UHCC-0300 TaxID=2974287 RepID=A0ABU5UA35_9CYAN|nr:2-succinyl-5-enolpyruvyl-6-hydroxy-3-cyclohexene-1-carboxylic-acid synthase [Nodularia harveyana]MEA5580385.1 2-succinyl-5-enolpyruvyl-6-hydroxy-3-cyclohexene-1-carboxylic-acid synthase [Nodularia harveyana UHCC-0300]
MTIDISNLNTLWASLIVEELIRNNINYFIISIGSRSTPLTVAVARHPGAKNIVFVDERSAAFHAIGYARAKGKPAVLISTSGTASANYFPAVIEASTDTVPMIILSADRPPELHQTGANQTIQQFNLYGNYTKWQFNLPCPDQNILPQMVLTTINQAIYQSQKSPAGAVHINCMFREPLAPINADIDQMYLASLNNWQEQQKPYTKYTHSICLPDTTSINQLAEIINHTNRGIIVVGRLNNQADIQAITQLAIKLNWPVFTDIQSGLRLTNSIPQIINYYDQLLLTNIINKEQPLETILQFGNFLTSKRFLQLLHKHQFSNHIVVIDHDLRDDPEHTVSLRIDAKISEVCNLLVPHIDININSDWVKKLKQKSQLVNQSIDNFLFSRQEISEPAVARMISRYIPQNNGLFLANSMPIRDMDMYAAAESSTIVVAANRGTSGIEGTIASAMGFAAGLNSPVTLLIGDLSFLYDLNSLALLKSISQPLIIVIINNNGGGIFSFLPIANFQDVFEQYFGVPHAIKFRYSAQMFGIDYYAPDTNEAFMFAYQEAINNQRPAVIEVETDRDANYDLHQELQQKIVTDLQNSIM